MSTKTVRETCTELRPQMRSETTQAVRFGPTWRLNSCRATIAEKQLLRNCKSRLQKTIEIAAEKDRKRRCSNGGGVDSTHRGASKRLTVVVPRHGPRPPYRDQAHPHPGPARTQRRRRPSASPPSLSPRWPVGQQLLASQPVAATCTAL